MVAGTMGVLDWKFDVCDETCWFYEHSRDPHWHGVTIEMGFTVTGGQARIVWIEDYG